MGDAALAQGDAGVEPAEFVDIFTSAFVEQLIGGVVLDVQRDFFEEVVDQRGHL
jgi:hypothetical protein